MSNIPELRFKEFSGEWERKKYGDIYSFYPTNSLSREKLNYTAGEVYNIHYGDIHTKFSTLFKLENENVPSQI
jgi:type I restriction enzyme S subunit